LADLSEIWRKKNAESHGHRGHVTKAAIFENSGRQTAAILKIVYLHISAPNHPISIKFCTQMWISIPRMVIWQKIEILEIQHGGRTHIEKFSCIFRRHFRRFVWNLDVRCRITCKQRSRDQNSNFRQSRVHDTYKTANIFLLV